MGLLTAALTELPGFAHITPVPGLTGWLPDAARYAAGPTGMGDVNQVVGEIL